jgi:hypothetical protein
MLRAREILKRVHASIVRAEFGTEYRRYSTNDSSNAGGGLTSVSVSRRQRVKDRSRHPSSTLPYRVRVAASEIASLINLHPHSSASDAIERLWEKNNRKTFREALARNQLQTFTPEERLKDLGVLELATAVIDAKDPGAYKQKLKEVLPKVSTVQDQAVLRDFVNTSRGKKHEPITFESLKQTRPSTEFKSDKTRYERLIQIPNSFVEYIVAGYVDGVDTTNNRIIEIKNRQQRFLNCVPLYEQVQCQAYLFLTGVDVCEHTESFRGELKSTTLQFEPAFWKTVIGKLNRVILAYCDLMVDVTLQDKFLKRKENVERVKTRSKKKATASQVLRKSLPNEKWLIYGVE